MAKNVQKDVDPKTDTQASDEPFLGTWKTKADAEEGISNLQGKLTEQGTELGIAKKQIQFFQDQLEKATAQPKAEPKKEEPKGPDFGKEMKGIQDKIAKLDPDEPDYQKELAGLMAKSTDIAMNAGAERALEAAQAQFKEALDERDIQAMHKDFYRENEDFNTPEMQTRIQERLAADQTGMSDPMVAYREIQRDDAAQAATVLEEENTELKRLLDLKKGEDETGKVVTKTGSLQQKTKPPKATGADLDKGMQEALDALRT